MTHESIDKFRLMAPVQLPGLIDPQHLESIDDYGDYALLTYSLAQPAPLYKLLNDMEDRMNLNILYHVSVPSVRNSEQHACAYASPSMQRMFKLNVRTLNGDVVRLVYVYVFESIEVMLEYLKDDLDRHLRMGRVLSQMKMSTLIADFM